MARIIKSKRPRFRRHRKHSRKFQAFLDAMETKWDGEETPVTVSVVGSDVVTISGDPGTPGPLSLRGVPPPEFRDFDRFWITYDAGDASVYATKDSIAGATPIEIASWDLSPDWTALGTPVAVEAVSATNNTLGITGHGYAVGDGPFYVASDGTIPAGLTGTTPYWVKTVPDADTFTVAASLGGAVVDITNAGSGSITWTPVNVDVSLDTIEVVGHLMETGDGPFRLTTGGGLPTGALTATDYWAIKVTDDRFKLATSYDNAIAGTPVNLTGIGTGTSTVARALTIGKDLTAGGLIEWMAQGVAKDAMATSDVSDVDTLFV